MITKCDNILLRNTAGYVKNESDLYKKWQCCVFVYTALYAWIIPTIIVNVHRRDINGIFDNEHRQGNHSVDERHIICPPIWMWWFGISTIDWDNGQTCVTFHKKYILKKTTMIIINGTLQCRYDAANFLPNPYDRHPIRVRHLKGIFWEYRLWFLWRCSYFSAIYNDTLC